MGSNTLSIELTKVIDDATKADKTTIEPKFYKKRKKIC